MSKRKTLVLFAALLGFGLTACETDFRERAKGNISEFIVVMDSTKWEGKTAEAVRNTFGKLVFTLPNPESFYNLSFTDIRSKGQVDRLKSMKNVMFVAPLDDSSNVAAQIRSFLDDAVEERVRNGESFAFPIKDQWYRDQYALILTSTSDSALAEKIINSERALLSDILERELERWEYEVYRKKEQTQLSDSLWNRFGFKVRFQHDYHASVDTTNFLTYRRYLPENDRWMWIWWKDNVNGINFLDDDWINATRDSLSQIYVKGSGSETYVTTEYRRPVTTQTFQKDHLIAYETLGTWRMENAAMGGPFVNFTYYDPNTDRLFMIEYSQFSPKVREKLPFVRQFRAMGRTFVNDSTRTE
ncbi:MAG: DUF4837 family protein [Balneolaceae bacterium]